MSDLSWLNPTPHAIAVYASQPTSPLTTQHSLPSGRYSLLGPDFHRLDRTSFAWRTHSITSSARASSVGGISIPSALAVLRLMTSSNLVGCTHHSLVRWPSGKPRLRAFCRSAPAVRFMALTIFLTGDLLRECALSSRTSSFDRRLVRRARLVAINPSRRRCARHLGVT